MNKNVDTAMPERAIPRRHRQRTVIVVAGGLAVVAVVGVCWVAFCTTGGQRIPPAKGWNEEFGYTLEVGIAGDGPNGVKATMDKTKWRTLKGDLRLRFRELSKEGKTYYRLPVKPAMISDTADRVRNPVEVLVGKWIGASDLKEALEYFYATEGNYRGDRSILDGGLDREAAMLDQFRNGRSLDAVCLAAEALLQLSRTHKDLRARLLRELQAIDEHGKLPGAPAKYSGDTYLIAPLVKSRLAKEQEQ